MFLSCFSPGKQDYVDAFLYKYHARKPKATFGNHAATMGLKFPFSAKTEANLPTKIYTTQIRKPIAR